MFTTSSWNLALDPFSPKRRRYSLDSNWSTPLSTSSYCHTTELLSVYSATSEWSSPEYVSKSTAPQTDSPPFEQIDSDFSINDSDCGQEAQSPEPYSDDDTDMYLF
ncbi:hypothetical protein RCL1_005151 [Eukaryota sp. TZLM3-RCL]